MHTPSLGANNGTRRKGIPHHIEGIVNLGGGSGGDHPLEQGRSGTVDSHALQKVSGAEYVSSRQKSSNTPSLMNAFKYGNLQRVAKSGTTLRSGMCSSSSACRFLRMSLRRLSSQQKYDKAVEDVSTPATLFIVVIRSGVGEYDLGSLTDGPCILR